MKIQEYCTFDCTNETAGEREDCPELATHTLPIDPEAFPNQPLTLCERHHYYLMGYWQGRYDESGRPNDTEGRKDGFGSDPADYPAFLNQHFCHTCKEARRSVSQFVIEAHRDPTTAYRLECGHATID